MTRFLSDRDWMLSPGPEEFEAPFYSYEVMDDLPEYGPEAVTEALLALPGISLTHASDPSWWEWRAAWQGPGGLIEFEMSLFEPDGALPSFGGFSLVADCEIADMLSIWVALRSRFARLWMHAPDCQFVKPVAFASAVGT